MNYFRGLHIHNDKPFTQIVDGNFGRKIIYTKQNQIDENNIVNELEKALSIHGVNAYEVDYLDNYYRGDQPSLYRKKPTRPEINNKTVENLAQYIVSCKVADIAGEPIQYVLHGTDKAKSLEITELNSLMESEDKGYYDIELCRWRSICGTAYRFIGKDDSNGSLLDECDFYFETCDPRDTFVAYYQNGKPAFGCMIREDEKGGTLYNVYTNTQYFLIADGEIVKTSINANRAIPVIEYPNNARRLSDIEITITLTDALNELNSSRIDGIQQFVNSWIKFVNCAVDKDSFDQMRLEGALVVKSNNGSENKADVDVITNELNQTESQVAVTDIFEKLLIIQGLANRQATSSGDTGSAVTLRNGWYDQEKRAELSEPIFKRSERMALRIILNHLRVNKGFTLVPSDVEIKISRTKADNILTKAETLQLMLQSGINPARAIKTADIWSDPEQVAVESSKRMEVLYPEEETQATTVVNNNSENADNGTTTIEQAQN